MKTTIANIVRERNHVTFSELQHAIPGFAGDIRMTRGSDPNLIFWPWCSLEAITALESLMAERVIFFHQTDFKTYLVHHPYPPFPLAQRPPPGGYIEPHWCPVCICDHPIDPKAPKKIW